MERGRITPILHGLFSRPRCCLLGGGNRITYRCVENLSGAQSPCLPSHAPRKAGRYRKRDFHKTLDSDERKRQLLSYARKGSTREALTKEMVTAFEITLPLKALMRELGEAAGTIFRERVTLELRNQKLRAARDLPPPRLMRGEIAV